MKKVAIYKDDLFIKHTNGPQHPECPERLISINSTLEQTGLDKKLLFPEFDPATKEQITAVHTQDYFDKIKSTKGIEFTQLDADTSACDISFEAALKGSGALIHCLDSILNGEIDTGFVMPRPPGHHAEKDRAMGFCLFNHTAVGAAHLLNNHSIERVLILDWDVHHGQGIQYMFYDDPR